MNFDKTIAVVSLTREGAKLALKIKKLIPNCDRYSRLEEGVSLPKSEGEFLYFRRLKDIISDLWQNYDLIICIMATGIVVRTIAHLISDKKSDPAILVMDEKGHFVISLLSGHVGGANLYATWLAEKLGAIPVITTASDVQKKPALDLLARTKDLEIKGVELMSKVMINLLDNHPVWLYDPYKIVVDNLSRSYLSLKPVYEENEVTYLDYCGIWVSERLPPESAKCVRLHPKNLIVGIGCNSGTEAEEIINLVRKVFSEERLAIQSIKFFASIDIKRSEEGLNRAAFFFERKIIFFSQDELKDIDVPNPSSIVKQHVGVLSVCEAAALKAHREALLIVPKKKTKNVTLAVAKAPYIWSV